MSVVVGVVLLLQSPVAENPPRRSDLVAECADGKQKFANESETRNFLIY